MSEELECLLKILDGILSLTCRSNPPPNLSLSYLKFLQLVVLNYAFEKVESYDEKINEKTSEV